MAGWVLVDCQKWTKKKRHSFSFFLSFSFRSFLFLISHRKAKESIIIIYIRVGTEAIFRLLYSFFQSFFFSARNVASVHRADRRNLIRRISRSFRRISRASFSSRRTSSWAFIFFIFRHRSLLSLLFAISIHWSIHRIDSHGMGLILSLFLLLLRRPRRSTPTHSHSQSMPMNYMRVERIQRTWCSCICLDLFSLSLSPESRVNIGLVWFTAELITQLHRSEIGEKREFQQVRKCNQWRIQAIKRVECSPWCSAQIVALTNDLLSDFSSGSRKQQSTSWEFWSLSSFFVPLLLSLSLSLPSLVLHFYSRHCRAREIKFDAFYSSAIDRSCVKAWARTANRREIFKWHNEKGERKNIPAYIQRMNLVCLLLHHVWQCVSFD